MSRVGEREWRTRQQVLELFEQHLDYCNLGNWKNRDGNRNVEEGLPRHWLERQGYEERIINRALRERNQAALIANSKTPYHADPAVHEKQRYGVYVKPSVEEHLWLFDWNHNVGDGKIVSLVDKREADA